MATTVNARSDITIRQNNILKRNLNTNKEKEIKQKTKIITLHE